MAAPAHGSRSGGGRLADPAYAVTPDRFLYTDEAAFSVSGLMQQAQVRSLGKTGAPHDVTGAKDDFRRLGTFLPVNSLGRGIEAMFINLKGGGKATHARTRMYIIYIYT